MRRFWIVLVTALVVIAGAYSSRSVNVSASGRSNAVAAKKHCKTVKKHGQKKTVCHTVRRAPTPTATPVLSLPQQVDAYLEQAHFSGSVLIAGKGEVLVSKGYGMADREHSVANTPQTRFRLASVTKQFTAMAILQLQEQGKLGVQDRACIYIASCPATWKDITIHQLLNHTSGIPDLFDDSVGYDQAKYYSPDQIIGLVRDQPLLFKPGTESHYSTIGYILLGLVIEKASGEPYEMFLRDHIFQPVGMTNTGLAQEGVAVPNLAVGYDGISPVLLFDPATLFAGGSLYSTVGDLYLWDQALATEKLASKKSLGAIFTPSAPLPLPFPGLSGYGYGWAIGTIANHSVILHGGHMPGVSTINGFFPDDRVTIIILSNDDQADMEATFWYVAKVVFQ
jgi:CubicO group peptidase (beta-lactamase class C family)